MIYLDQKGDWLPWKVVHQMGSAVLQERGMRKKSAKSILQSANGDWEGSKLSEKRQKWGGGVSSAEWNKAAPIQVEELQWGLKSAPPAEERWKEGGWVRSVECNIGVPVGIKELPSQAEEHGNGRLERGMKYRSSNQDRGWWSAYSCGDVQKVEQLTAEGYRREWM
jgi:hypothetical protein